MINGSKGFDCMGCHHLWNGRCRTAMVIGEDISKKCVHFVEFGVYDYGRGARSPYQNA